MRRLIRAWLSTILTNAASACRIGRRATMAALAVATTLLSAGCASSDTTTTPPPAPVATITVSGRAALPVGDTAQLTAVTLDAAGAVLTRRTIAWSSSSIGVASVSSAGIVTAIATGSATVTATSEGKLGSLAVTVGPAPVASVGLSSAALSLQVGQTQQLTATARDAAGNALTGRTTVWSSSNSAVATVSSNGLVTAIAAGAAAVTVTVEGTSAAASVSVAMPAVAPFNLSRELLGTPGTLAAQVQALDAATRQVSIGGVDTRAPLTPFTFDWGDGIVTSGFFTQSHTYASASRNYLVHVTAHYSSSDSDHVDITVRFVAPQFAPTAFPVVLTVTVPSQLPLLTSRQPGLAPPANLVAFDDSYFSPTATRTGIEYLLSQAAGIEFAILEGDVEFVNGGFRQGVLRDPAAGGAYSIWYTSPVALGANGAFLQGTPGYSSFFHEMSHNLSLNAPAAFRFGGRIDGNANAILSESVAQMFQHTVAYEIVNNRALYGVPDDLALDIANSARASATIVRTAYDSYVAQGMPFSTWNDPATPGDETLGTFMVVARQFLVHADNARSYVVPLTRTMRLLRTFNQSILNSYAPQTNSLSGIDVPRDADGGGTELRLPAGPSRGIPGARLSDRRHGVHQLVYLDPLARAGDVGARGA